MGDETDLSASEFATWVRVPDALKLFENVSFEGRIRAISERIKLGILRCAAETAVFRMRTDGNHAPRFFEPVPAIWLHWSPEDDDHFWETGDTSIPINTGQQIVSQGDKLFGVRLDPAGLVRMGLFPAGSLPRPDPVVSPVAPAPAGGRPPKAFWEDMIVEMFRRSFLDSFQPKSQSELERAMLDWAGENQHDASESAVKIRARKIWPVLKS